MIWDFLKFRRKLFFFLRAHVCEGNSGKDQDCLAEKETPENETKLQPHETIPGKSLLKADAPTAERVAPCLYRTSQPKEVYPSLTKGKGRYSPGTMPAAPSRSTRAREANQKR